MPPSGKKTERLWLPWQLCCDPLLACRIRDLADRGNRKLEDQLRRLIMLGLIREEQIQRNEQQLTFLP